jgi:hypothetical protein
MAAAVIPAVGPSPRAMYAYRAPAATTCRDKAVYPTVQISRMTVITR